MSKSAGSRPRVALKIIRQPRAADRDDAADEHEVDVAPRRGGVARQAAERAGRHAGRGSRTSVVAAISRARPRTVGREAVEDLEATALGRRRSSRTGSRQHVEQPAGHRRRHRAAEAGLLEQHRDGVLRRRWPGRRRRTPRWAPCPLPTCGGAGLAGDRERVVGKPLKAPTAVPPALVVTPVRPSKIAWPPLGRELDLCRAPSGSMVRFSSLGDAVAHLLHHVRLPDACRRWRWWRSRRRAAAGVSSTSPWPMAMLTLLPVRQLSAPSTQPDVGSQ